MKLLAITLHLATSGLVSETMDKRLVAAEIPDSVASAIESGEVALKIPGAGPDATFTVSESFPLVRIPFVGELKENGVAAISIEITDVSAAAT